ncbi:MAG: glycosyltransferase [Deltaproteobacteria bacterium]|jgi:spore maturation protein CgeB|nr:glycosyltransferase [Deltaproteobacteria bacterium]
MSRQLRGRGGPLRVAIADDAGLIYSDDYRRGWVNGFKGIGCEVKAFDISPLRGLQPHRLGPYVSTRTRGFAKGLAKNLTTWRPDLVFCHHGRAASNEEFLAEIRRFGARTAVYLCDEPYESGETCGYSPRFSAVFTMDWCTVAAHRKSRNDRSAVFYLPPGVDVDHFRYVSYDDRPVSAFFLGNPNLIPRHKWLKPVERVVEGAQILFWKTPLKGGPQWIPLKEHPARYASCRVGLNVHRSPVITKECFKKRVLGRRPQSPVPKGIKLVAQMPPHEGTGFWNEGNLPASHVNPRFLEMAACGTLVVSDNHRSELKRLFPMAPQASDPDHFLELVLHYLDHPEEAEEIGKACSYLVSKRHSYRHRAAEVLIRLGLKESGAEDLHSSLGAPEDWLSPQDLPQLAASSSLDPTGHSERWSPRYGMSLINQSGNPKEASSTDVQTPWLA